MEIEERSCSFNLFISEPPTAAKGKYLDNLFKKSIMLFSIGCLAGVRVASMSNRKIVF